MTVVRLLIPALMLFSGVALTACSDDKDDKLHGCISGTAMMLDPQDSSKRIITVTNGQDVSLAVIGNFQLVSYNGSLAPLEVHYLIDGQDVVTSNSSSTAFSVLYSVENLKAGEHELSANIVSIFKNVEYENQIAASKFTVTEAP